MAQKSICKTFFLFINDSFGRVPPTVLWEKKSRHEKCSFLNQVPYRLPIQKEKCCIYTGLKAVLICLPRTVSQDRNLNIYLQMINLHKREHCYTDVTIRKLQDLKQNGWQWQLLLFRCFKTCIGPLIIIILKGVSWELLTRMTAPSKVLAFAAFSQPYFW